MLLQRRATSAAVVVLVMVMTVVKAEADDSGYDDSPPPPRYYSASQSSRNKDDDFTKEANYDFNYSVRDDHFSTNFGHEKKREGKNTKGSYYVHLPDGRVQKVTYHVDGDSGYVAEVSYEGEARRESSGPPKSYRRSSRESEESYSPPRASRRHTRESGESLESYTPPRASYRARESVRHESSAAQESKESYVALSFTSPQFEEPAKRPHKEPSTSFFQSPVGPKTSRRRSKHTSSEETRAYSPPKPSLVSGSYSNRKDSSEENGSQGHHNSHFSTSSGFKEKRRRTKGSKDVFPAPRDSYEVPHPSRYPTSSEEKSRRVKDSKDTSSAPKDSYELPYPSRSSSSSEEKSRRVKDSQESSVFQESYEAPVYIPNYPHPPDNSYRPENLLRGG